MQWYNSFSSSDKMDGQRTDVGSEVQEILQNQIQSHIGMPQGFL